MDKYVAVSVILPVYNDKQTLKRCMDSILNQTYRDFEIVIIDDASTDETMEYIDFCYGGVTDINIIYIRNDSRVGYAASANIGISNAGGEYIAFHNARAWWTSDKLEKQMAYMSHADKSVGAVYGKAEYQREWGVPEYYPRETLGTDYKEGDIYFALLPESFIRMETLLIRKDILFAIGGFTEELNALEDYDLTLRAAGACYIGYVDETLALKQETDVSLGGADKEAQIKNRIEAHFYLMKLYRDDLKRFDMKKRKFEAVYEEAVSCGSRHLFFQLLPMLLEDTDYMPYVQEKIQTLNPSSHPEKVETTDISGVTACTGCMACQNKCPVDAITTECDSEGFLTPVIDAGKCIHCGKCREVCPVCNEIANKGVLLPDDCYAIMGKTQIRRRSSSGGLFGMLAENILEEGGYVSGAVWNEDWQVEHIVSNQQKDIERMRSSKYIQSNMGMTYRKVKELLENGETVLFTGCGCQIAGLKCYLGKEYDKLLLAEVVCHGVPPQAVFNSYIRNFDNIEYISFRDKNVLGWDVGLYIRYQNGAEYRGGRNDTYLFGFLNNWILRQSCYDCKFKSKTYGDITIGDFWGIGRIPELDDGLGTSFAALNTAKGAAYLEKIRGGFEKITCLRTEHAKQCNMCISESVDMPACRELFFAQWKEKQDMAFAVAAVKEQIHFDIALVVLWSMNYGNALTNYALYRYLEKQGRRVVILDDCIKPKKQFKKFAKEHYVLSSAYFPTFQYEMMNHSCDTFVAGSDQAWNCKIYEEDRNYFYLDFAADDRKKVSYSASFGKPEGMPSPERGKKFLGRFQAVSLREAFGAALCEKLYGIQAQRVLDPVFLLEKEDYEELIGTVPLIEEPYIVTYLLNPTKEKRRMCLEVQARLGGMKMVNMIDASPAKSDYNRKILEYDTIKADLSVEEWLFFMRHSRFVITDSFHGTCFAMIFEKEFITFRARETERFDIFLTYPELAGRILTEREDYDMEYLLSKIPYCDVKNRLAIEKEASKQFIREYIL